MFRMVALAFAVTASLSLGGCAAGVVAGATFGAAKAVKTTAKAAGGAVRVTGKAGRRMVDRVRGDDDAPVEE